MRVEQHIQSAGEDDLAAVETGIRPDLIVVFGERSRLQSERIGVRLRELFPRAQVVGCSTAGEIGATSVFDGSVVITKVSFDHTLVRTAVTTITNGDSGFESGVILARQLRHDHLRHVFVLSDGISVNGSELVKGLSSILPSGVGLTGGLSADGSAFKETVVIADGECSTGTVVAVGFYGDRFRVGYGSLGGWDPFGPERRITKSEGNVLYELDGRSALSLYKEYLGEYAQGLPATGLLFPLAVGASSDAKPVVRTILAVDEQSETITFAGDLPMGASARLMRANFERLIDGANDAALSAHDALRGHSSQLAILISCVGRKLVLKQRIEEEVEAARGVLGQSTVLTGFYSYGEIAPFCTDAPCELHNQTMTITAFREE